MNASTDMRPSSREFAALLPIVALAAIVRWIVVDRDALWLDEGYSWWDARQPLRSLWTLVPTCDPHPPLYFATLHGWVAAFGDSTVAMRSLSMLFGMAAVVVVYCCGRKLDRASGRADPRFGIGAFAALLFALTPFQVYFSVEARPYALFCLGAALLTFGCLSAVEASRSSGPPLAPARTYRMGVHGWISLVIGGLIVVWTNNTAVLVLGAATCAFVGLWWKDRDSRNTIVPVVVAGGLIALLWAPDWPLLYAQGKEVSGDFWIQRPSLERLTYELHQLIGLDVLTATWWIALAMFGGLLAIGRKIGRRWMWMLSALAILPIAFNVAISYAVSPILLSRALIGATPALVLALASSALLVRIRALRVVVVVALLLVHAIALERYLAADHVKEPWTPLVARLAVLAGGAPVLVVPNELVLPLAHEAAGQHLEFAVHGLPADYPAIDLKARYPSGKCAPSVVDQDLGPLITALHADARIVLLTRLHNTYDPDQAVAAALRTAGYALRDDEVFQPGDLRIMRFVRTND